MLVVSTNRYNDSAISTVVVLAITSNLKLKKAPGNVLLRAASSGLDRDSVVSVTQVLTLDKSQLGEFVGAVPTAKMNEVTSGLQMVLKF